MTAGEPAQFKLVPSRRDPLGSHVHRLDSDSEVANWPDVDFDIRLAGPSILSLEPRRSEFENGDVQVALRILFSSLGAN